MGREVVDSLGDISLGIDGKVINSVYLDWVEVGS